MEKQGLKFFILRALARRLQKWADVVFRQVGEERPDPRNQVNTEKVETGSAAEASRVVSPPVAEGTDVNNPPDHWLARADAGEPPAQWLARVQKDAPELLKREGQSRRNVAAQSHPLPAGQADSNVQVTGAEARQRARADEIARAEEDTSGLAGISKREGEEGRARRDEPDVPTFPNAVAQRNKMEWVEPFISRFSGEPHGERVRTRKGEGGEDEGMGPFEYSGRPGVEGLVPQGARRATRASPPHIPAAPAPTDDGVRSAQKTTSERWAEQGEGPALTNQREMGLMLSPGRWQSPPMQTDSSPWEKRAGRSSLPQTGHNRWSQASIATPTNGHRSLEAGEAGEQIQTAMRWPSLPEEVATDGQDWEMAWRVWERQQRLDQEQRGSSWNV